MEELLSSSAETLGNGTFGYSYVVNLKVTDAVAVKRLKVACVSEAEFKERVHQNLLPVRAYFFHADARRLLCDYMPTGSLSSFLHGSEGIDKTPLSWEIRTKIAYGVARGIEYLHYQGPNVCHGNIRSSNVFLTNSYEARLSEFGIAQLVSVKAKANLASGYCAPEVKYAHEVYQQADVYSFGVLLFELLTGKSPLNALSNNEGVDLPKWVRLMFQEKPIIDVFDNELLRYQKNNTGEQMVQILQLATCCTFQHPNRRPLMPVVTNRIRDICGFKAM